MLMYRNLKQSLPGGGDLNSTDLSLDCNQEWDIQNTKVAC